MMVALLGHASGEGWHQYARVTGLQDAGGWKSIAMPARYAERQKVANEGVKLD